MTGTPVYLNGGEHSKDEWQTPDYIVEWIAKLLGGVTWWLDPFTDGENGKAPYVLTGPCIAPLAGCECGLCSDWSNLPDCPGGDAWAWVNPPYTIIPEALEKAYSERNWMPSACLVTNPTDAGWWDDARQRASRVIMFTRGRIQFTDPAAPERRQNTKGSTLFVYDAATLRTGITIYQPLPPDPRAKRRGKK